MNDWRVPANFVNGMIGLYARDDLALDAIKTSAFDSLNAHILHI